MTSVTPVSGPTLVVAQSGGPTPVVNASIVGALRAARTSGKFARVLGARFGLEGVQRDDYVDLTELDEAQLGILERTPGASLGSSRHRQSDEELRMMLDRLQVHGVRAVAMVGGNDSAETLHRLHLTASAAGVELAAVGIPKTVDNDLPEMDHCPGYGSAARYIAQAAREAGLDSAAMRHTDPVKVIEVAGRHAGWLAAASALARDAPGDPPHLIFLPERPRSLAQMIEEVRAVQAAHGWAIVVISENQTDDRGQPLAGGQPIFVDPHGHAYHESPGQFLVRMVQSETELRARYERPGSLQRTSLSIISDTDRREAAGAGAEAVRRALAGESDIMVAIQRQPGPEYRVRYGAAPLAAIAHAERLLPDALIDPSGVDVTDAFLAYAQPLIGGPLPPALRFT